MSMVKKIFVIVLVLAAVGALLYGFGVFDGGAQPLMTMTMTPMRDRDSGLMVRQPTFSFSAPIRIQSLRFYNDAEYTSQGETAMPVWALAGNPSSAPVRQFTYGQRVPRMKGEKDAGRALPLVRDQHYRMIAKTDHGTFDQPFVYGPQQQ